MVRCNILTHFALVCMVALSATGCGGSSEKFEIQAPLGALQPVTGTVKMNGEPLGNALVQLVPFDSKKATFSQATTDSSGSFTMKKMNGQEGVEVGRYKCVVSKYAKADGSLIPADAPGDVMGMGIQHVPEKYSDPMQTELNYEIPMGGKKLEIVLTK